MSPPATTENPPLDFTLHTASTIFFVPFEYFSSSYIPRGPAQKTVLDFLIISTYFSVSSLLISKPSTISSFSGTIIFDESILLLSSESCVLAEFTFPPTNIISDVLSRFSISSTFSAILSPPKTIVYGCITLFRSFVSPFTSFST